MVYYVLLKIDVNCGRDKASAFAIRYFAFEKNQGVSAA